jgi:soluble lytic murein transglycosylase-like protein
MLSNFQSSDTPTLLLSAAGAPNASDAKARRPRGRRADRVSIPVAFKKLVEEAARRYGVDPMLLHAVINAESGYNQEAVSPKGALGLMQLMPATALRFGVTNVLDPRENLKAGARYLSWLLKRFGGDLELALAGYNAGEQAVVRAGYRIPANDETTHYVPKVLNNYFRIDPS